MELSFSARVFAGLAPVAATTRCLSPAPRPPAPSGGVRLGEVVDVSSRSVEVRLAAPLRRGDGSSSRGTGRPTLNREGFTRSGVAGCGWTGRPIRVSSSFEFQHAGDRFFGLLRPGLQVWKTDDPQLTNRLRKTFTGPDPRRGRSRSTRPGRRRRAGWPLLGQDRRGAGAVSVASEQLLETARKHPATREAF